MALRKQVVTWDEEKRRRNLAKHGVDLALATEFDFLTADIREDVSVVYGEQREVAIGWLQGEIYVYVYTLRGDEDHAISLRKATPQERRRYAEEN